MKAALALLTALLVLCSTQSPYSINQIMNANGSTILAMWMSPTGSLLRIVNSKYQIITYEIVKGNYSLTGIKQLNTNAAEIDFSLDGNFIFYRANLQNDGVYLYKIYKIPDGVYWSLSHDPAVMGAKLCKSHNIIAFYWRNGNIGTYTFGVNYALVLYQNLLFPDYPALQQLSQLAFTFAQNTTLNSPSVFQPLPLFQKEISGAYWSPTGDLLLVVYNRDTYIVIYKNSAKKFFVFQTLDYPTSKIYVPLISSNTSKIMIPSQGRIFECDLESMESKTGQYVLTSIIPIDLTPKIFLASADFNILIVANQTDMVVFEYNKAYQQKWRVKFTSNIDNIAFSDGVHLLVSLTNKEGVYDFTSCVKANKNCSTSNLVFTQNPSVSPNTSNTSNTTNKVSSTSIRTQSTTDTDEPENQSSSNYLTLINLALNILLIILVIGVIVFGVIIYLRVNRITQKSQIPAGEDFKETQLQFKENSQSVERNSQKV